MIEAAKAEGAREAQQSFSWANEVEKVHAELFSKALKDPAALPRVDYYVCATCGYTVEGQPPQKCPICGSAREAFRKVD
jgi:rubrerythrin